MADKIRADAIATAREWLRPELNTVFLDTETTGLGYRDEVVSVALVDLPGNVLLNTLIKPRIPIGAEAAAIHRITQGAVDHAPGFDAILPILLQLTVGWAVVMWNANFDHRMLRQSIAKIAMAEDFNLDPCCAMELYAQFWGEWDRYHGNFRWQKLSLAAAQCGIEIRWQALHSVRVDADLCRQIIQFVAAQEENHAR